MCLLEILVTLENEPHKFKNKKRNKKKKMWTMKDSYQEK